MNHDTSGANRGRWSNDEPLPYRPIIACLALIATFSLACQGELRLKASKAYQGSRESVETGAQGQPGATGQQGEQALKANRESRGGPAGSRGSTGPQGARGPQGPRGEAPGLPPVIYDLSDLNRIANSLDTLFDGGTWASTDDSDTGTLRWTTLTVSTGHIVYNHGPHSMVGGNLTRRHGNSTRNSSKDCSMRSASTTPQRMTQQHAS